MSENKIESFGTYLKNEKNGGIIKGFVPGQISFSDGPQKPELPQPKPEVLLESENKQEPEPEPELFKQVNDGIPTEVIKEIAGPNVNLEDAYYAVKQLMEDLGAISRKRSILNLVYPYESEDSGKTYVRKFNQEGFDKFYFHYKDSESKKEVLERVRSARDDLDPLNEDALSQIKILMGDENKYKPGQYKKIFSELIKYFDKGFGFKRSDKKRRDKFVQGLRPNWIPPERKEPRKNKDQLEFDDF